ncbi:MAG: flagellar basal body P-ring formation chaperone FlgA, partial [Pseudomonadota bacterium]
MKRLALSIFVLAAMPAHAEDAVMLKEKTIVSGETVLLNDLLAAPIAHGKVAVFAAPAPGESGTINVQRVIEAARNYGVEKITMPAWTSVQIEREARVIKTQDIQHALADKAANGMRISAEDVDVSFSRDIDDVALEKTNDAPLQFSYYRRDTQSGRFEARLYVPDSAYISETSPIVITGTINEMVDVVQLNHSVSRGDVITKSDIAMTRISRQQLAGNALRHASDAVGMIAKRTIAENTMLRGNDVEKQKLISRNDMIMVLYQTPTLTVTTRAKAMTDGALGDVIEIQNMQSKRALSATVSGSGQVIVTSLATRRVAE